MVPDHKQSVYWDYNNQTLKEVSRPTHIQGPGLGPQYKMLVGGRVLEVYTLRVNFSGRYQCQTFINSTRETLLAWIYVHSNGQSVGGCVCLCVPYTLKSIIFLPIVTHFVLPGR